MKEFNNLSVPDDFTNSILILLPENISPNSYVNWLKYEILPYMHDEERNV